MTLLLMYLLPVSISDDTNDNAIDGDVYDVHVYIHGHDPKGRGNLSSTRGLSCLLISDHPRVRAPAD